MHATVNALSITQRYGPSSEVLNRHNEKNGQCTRRGFSLALASALLCSLAYSPASRAQSSQLDVRIIATSSGSAGARVVEYLRSRLPTSQVVGDVGTLPKHGNFKYIAVGPAALQLLLARDVEDPIFALLVPRLTYKDILENTGKNKALNVTAIYAEASPDAQMQLAKKLFKRETTIAVLYSQKTAYLQSPLRQAAYQANLRIEFIQVEEEGLNRAINRATESTAILAIPDESIYNAQNIRTILLSTYQRGKPVLGFSTSLVRAGALGTTYSTVEDMVAQVVELIQDYNATGRVPPLQYPKYFGVLVNDSVSRSLNIVIDEEVLKFGKKPVDLR